MLSKAPSTVIREKNMATRRKNIPEISPEPAAALDAIDRKILALLQEDNQITNQALAEKVGISPPPCHRRVRRLREEGIIARDVSLVDPVKVGRSLIVFASITLERQREDLLENFERKMMRHPEVMQCYFVSGMPIISWWSASATWRSTTTSPGASSPMNRTSACSGRASAWRG